MHPKKNVDKTHSDLSQKKFSAWITVTVSREI